MFAKVFRSLWEGSLYGRTDEQLVFIYLLCNANEHGEVDIIQHVIAGATGMEESRVRLALKVLEGGDGMSRTPDAGGRRIELLDEYRDWGWRIVNYMKYREMRSREARREQTRKATRAWRERASSAASGEQCEQPVSSGEQCEPMQKQKQKQRQIESEHLSANADVPERGKASPKPFSEEFEQFWEAYRCSRRKGKPAAYSTWRKLAGDKISEQILAALERFKKTSDWPAFAPEPERWLRKTEWDGGPVADETARGKDIWS